MTRMAVITPSYAPDFELCIDLHRSVLTCSPESVEHHIVVPRRDLELFGQLRGPRTYLHCESAFLPRSFVPLPVFNYSINIWRPLPPVRGWIRQQILKLAAASAMDVDVVVMVDSDIRFVRPFTIDTFLKNGVVRFYCKPSEVDGRLPRHVIWHRAARALLGLPATQPPFTDYVSSLLAWSPAVLRELLVRVEKETGKSWQTAVGSQLHFSEWTLYGVFVDEVLGAPANSFASDQSLCHSYWDEAPLDEVSIGQFIRGARPSDIAVMISAKSNTPLALRRMALNGI
jgi:hypothetical protein